MRRTRERREMSRLDGGETTERRRRPAQSPVERALLREPTRALRDDDRRAHVRGGAAGVRGGVLPTPTARSALPGGCVRVVLVGGIPARSERRVSGGVREEGE